MDLRSSTRRPTESSSGTRTDVRVINSTVHGSRSGGVWIGGNNSSGSRNALIKGNTVYDNVLSNSPELNPKHSGTWNQGISLTADNSTITGNIVYKNYGEGIGTGGNRGAIISNNTVYDNWSVNIYPDGADHATVTGNFVYGTGDANFTVKGHRPIGIGAALEGDSSPVAITHAVVANNIVIGTRYGFYYGSYERGGGMQNALIANNTFVNATEADIHIEPDKHSENRLVNNISYQSPPGILAETANRSGGGPLTGFLFRNNCWHGGVAGPFAGTGDVSADPLLIKPGSFAPADYKISDASPCRKSGATISEVTADFFGSRRTAPDGIGACQ